MARKRQTETPWSRLSAGTYEHSAGPYVSREYARDFFLREVQSLKPEVLQDLHASVFPYFPKWNKEQETTKKKKKKRYAGPPLLDRLATSEVGPTAALVPLWKQLQAWSSGWRLDEQWVRRRALDAMAYWQRHPSQELSWGVRGTRRAPLLTADERRFVFEHPGWEPSWRGSEHAKESIRKEFDAKLDEYFARIVACADERGWRLPKQKRSFVHFAWLVKFQVLEQDFAAIHGVRGDAQGARTVAEGIKKLARFIGLHLRPTAKGRPRGSRDTKIRRRPVRHNQPLSST